MIVGIGAWMTAWEPDGYSYYWDRNGAGNRDELRNLYQNNRDEYNRLRDQSLMDLRLQYRRHIGATIRSPLPMPTAKPAHVESVWAGSKVYDVSTELRQYLLQLAAQLAVWLQ
jgi:hypothetical protein